VKNTENVISKNNKKNQNQGFGSISGNNNDIHDIISRLTQRNIAELVGDVSTTEQPEWNENLVNSQEVQLEKD
jgi:hypothetical protein